MKICSRCREEKTKELFNKEKRNKDGFSYECKECLSKRKKESYRPEKYKNHEFKEKNRLKSLNFRRENPEKSSLYSKKWADKNKKKRSEYRDRWRKNNLKQVAANRFLQRYVNKGVITRGIICENCKKVGKMEAHHKDYTKPLEVNWLCRRCHMKIHRSI